MNTPLSKADSKIIIYSINWLQLLCNCLESIENPLLSHSRNSWETPPHVPQLELSCSSLLSGKAWGLMTGSRIDWFFPSLSACVCSCVRMCRCVCVWVPYEYICILKRMWFRNHLFLCNQSTARVVGANKQEEARGTRDLIAHVFVESQYQLEFIVSKYAEFKTGILPLWLGCCSGAQCFTRPTLVQTEARKWVFFFCSKVISIIITKSTAAGTRSTDVL